MSAQHAAEPESLIGRAVVDADGAKIGVVSQVYLDDATGGPEWIRVHTGWLVTRDAFVPLGGSSLSGSTLRVAVARDRVRHAPEVDATEHLSPWQQGELYRHYGIGGPERPAPGRPRDERDESPASPPTNRPITGMSGGVVTGRAGGKLGTGGELGAVEEP